jgi:hypothetical protein
MNEEAFAKQLVMKLDAGLTELPPEVVGRLESARFRARDLARLKSHGHAVHSAHGLAVIGWVRQHRTGTVGMLLVLLLGVAVAMWQSSSNGNDDTADVDAALLTGDLPVNAYLDNHLNKWTDANSN